MRKKLIIEILKDLIIKLMYYEFYDEKNIIGKTINNNIESMHYGTTPSELHYYTINDELLHIMKIFISENHSSRKYIRKKHIKKAFKILLNDKYLMKDAPNSERILLTEKGKYHHLNGKSFESEYKSNKIRNIQIMIAVIAIFVSSILNILKLFL